MYTHGRAVGAVIFIAWLALVYNAAASPSPTKQVITMQNGIPELIPLVDMVEPPIAAVTPPTATKKRRELPQNLRPTPYMNANDQYMLAVALGEESRIDNDTGQVAMINVVLNRIGTTKDRDSVADVLLESGQFSFLWGDTQTKAGRVLRSNDKAAIAKLAKAKYAKELAVVLDIVNKPHYIDITNGRTYYYNPRISSKKGAQWFAENVTDCKFIGLHHRFCYGQH